MTQKYTLDNGMKAVLTGMPYMKSVSIGIFVKSGSVYETAQNNGIAHFIEHMLFKGTKNRTARQISEESDELGGTLNAYTAEECTCLYIKVLADDIARALDLLFDIALNPVFDGDAIENEKKVILEEISGAEDNPEDAAQEMLMSNMFRGHPVGMPVLGSAENVRNFTRDEIEAFYRRRYIPQNMTVSVAGRFDERIVNDIIREKTLNVKPCIAPERDIAVPANIFGGIYRGIRDIGQLQLVAGYPSAARFDESLYAFILLSGILSGDSSSRLFRRLREENGLVYNVDAAAMEYLSTGVFVLSTGFSAENADKVISVIRSEIYDILQNGVTEQETMRTKRNIVASLELESESTMSVMASGGKRLLYGIELDSDEIKNKYLSVSREDIQSAAKAAFSDKTKEAVAVIGDCEGIESFSIIA